MSQPPPSDEVRRAAAKLRDNVRTGSWPFGYFAAACGWDADLPADDVGLWLEAATSTISPLNDPGTDIELQSAVMALEHADWLAIVVGMVRRDVGAELDARAVQRDLESMPEIEDDRDNPDDDLSFLDMALTVLTPLWQAIGALDVDARLTKLGRWGLPQALHITWSHSSADLGDRVAEDSRRPS